MTRTGYIFARLFTSFGIARTDTYRGNAAFESHLLHEAEEILGNLAWKETEQLEDISADYWQLRKLGQKHDALEKESESLIEQIEASQEARSNAIEEVSDKTRDQVQRRDQVAEQLERSRREEEEILRQGRSVKRTHQGLKAKLEVLQAESTDEQSLKQTKEQLKELRQKFDGIKKRREEIQARLIELDTELKELSELINKENQLVREKAENDFSNIGKANKQLTTIKSEMGSISQDANELFTGIGQYLITNQKDPEVKAIIAPHRKFVDLINALRASIDRNQRLFT
ncbi:MAG: hypothetical protein Q7Q71_07640 [Verrucomicrobiota bacterium JB023]|nr:hypothetical protein [Verrucomicrobiota bacterium JB023]